MVYRNVENWESTMDISFRGSRTQLALMFFKFSLTKITPKNSKHTKNIFGFQCPAVDGETFGILPT